MPYIGSRENFFSLPPTAECKIVLLKFDIIPTEFAISRYWSLLVIVYSYQCRRVIGYRCSSKPATIGGELILLFERKISSNSIKYADELFFIF